MKKIIIMIIFLISLNSVYADEIVDLNKKGSISITLKDNETPINNAIIEITKIGNAKIKNNNLVYEYVDDFTCSVKMEDENIDKISTCMENKTLEKITKTTKNGKVLFENLDLGVYLVKQTNDIKGYTKINSFLIFLPYVTNNSWEYIIDATPKVTLTSLTDITIKKIWNTDKNNKILDYVTIELYQNDKKINTIKLSKENNWEVTINDLPKSDTYKIKEINIPKGYVASYSNNNYTYTVTNTPELVQTGQMTYLYTFISFIGLTLVIIGLIINKGEQNEK